MCGDGERETTFDDWKKREQKKIRTKKLNSIIAAELAGKLTKLISSSPFIKLPQRKPPRIIFSKN